MNTRAVDNCWKYFVLYFIACDVLAGVMLTGVLDNVPLPGLGQLSAFADVVNTGLSVLLAVVVITSMIYLRRLSPWGLALVVFAAGHFVFMQIR